MTGEVALRPSCEACGAFYDLRPIERQAPEQRWCGVWYDHPPTLCGQSRNVVLYPSKALLEASS